jgi:hypothetical protein
LCRFSFCLSFAVFCFSLLGCHGGTGLSCIGGAMRLGEFQPGTTKTLHFGSAYFRLYICYVYASFCFCFLSVSQPLCLPVLTPRREWSGASSAARAQDADQWWSELLQGEHLRHVL